MAKKLLAVCDDDLEYVNRFMGYIKERTNLPFRVAGFSAPDSLDIFLERNSVDILLLSDRFVDALDNKSNKKIAEHFKEHSGVKELVLFGDRQDLSSRQKYLLKYRSIEEIIFDITTNFQIFMPDENETGEMATVDLIGIYPASDISKKQAFALALSHIISNSTSVLYINLERFSGLGTKGSDGRYSISDLIYFYKTDPRKIKESLNGAIKRISGFDAIFAPLDIEDVDLLEDDEIPGFIYRLAQAGGYETVILDMGEAFRRIENIFRLCNVVYVTSQPSYYFENRLNGLKSYISIKEGDKTAEKIKEVPVEKIKDHSIKDGDLAYFEECFFGSAGEIAEGIYYG